MLLFSKNAKLGSQHAFSGADDPGTTVVKVDWQTGDLQQHFYICSEWLLNTTIITAAEDFKAGMFHILEIVSPRSKPSIALLDEYRISVSVKASSAPCCASQQKFCMAHIFKDSLQEKMYYSV